MGIRLSEKAYKKLIQKENIKSLNKKNKYHNEKLVVDGVRYDSKREYLRHRQLLLREKAGEIQDLRFHCKSDTIILQNKPLIKYEPDFCYYENGVFVIEDLKGFQTKEFKLKKKMIINKIQNDEIQGIFRLTKIEKGATFIIEEYSKDGK